MIIVKSQDQICGSACRFVSNLSNNIIYTFIRVSVVLALFINYFTKKID